MTDQINPQRRGFVAAATSLIATPLSAFGLSGAQAAESSTRQVNGALSSFGPLKQVNAGLLNVGYAEVGPLDGPPVLLLHGWPYDIHTYVDVAPILARAGYRVLVPYARGYGTTQFLSDSTVRNGQQGALAQDTIAFMDALGIEKATVAGCDWGARTACIVSALWPDRFNALVSVSGYLAVNRELNKQPILPKNELEWWYQYYLSTERGRLGYAKYRAEFARLIWQQASPRWHFDDATFLRSAPAFDNSDHVAVVVHNYRWRIGEAEGEAKYDIIEAKITTAPNIQIPAITLEGDANGAPHPPSTAYAHKFSKRYEHRELKGGIGHNLPQEAPEAFAKAVIDVSRA